MNGRVENASKLNSPTRLKSGRLEDVVRPARVAGALRVDVRGVVDDRGEDGREDDPHEQVAGDADGPQADRDEDPDDRDDHRPGRERREIDGRARAAHDEPRVRQADERDEEADPDRDRLLQLDRDRVHDRLAQADEHQDQDCEALHDDEPHRLGEAQPGLRHERERHHRVQAEAGRDGVGHVRVEAHDDRHHPGDETGRGEDGVEGKPLLLEPLDAREPQDRRVHEDDVGHDDEGRHAGDGVPPEVRASFVEAESATER